MKLTFTKMHGCGNDYIYFDCFEQTVDDPHALSERISHRHFGVGGDGIVLIEPSKDADATMRMFNADGSEGNMCGNAIRCVAKYLYDTGRCKKEVMEIDTHSGVKTLYLNIDAEDSVESVRVDMGKAVFSPSKIPVRLEGEAIVNYPIDVDGAEYHITCVSMGNPHAVVFIEQAVADLPLWEIGPKFERHALFPERVNTEFIRVIDEHTLDMRVWERGSGETMACGTGACAAVAAAVKCGHVEKDTDITVRLLGGELIICYTEETVTMQGPAATVFEGEIEA